MSFQTPFFSIIIPTYNRAGFIAKTLTSVLKQEYAHFEVIIVDDGSTDNTPDVVKPFLGEKVFYFKKQNEERAAARNFGISKAKGDYITFVDSDDLLYPNYFSTANNLLLQNEFKPVFFHLGYEMRDGANTLLSQVNKRTGEFINQDLIHGNSLSCIGIFVKKEIFEEQKFNPIRALSGTEDYELWLRLAARFPLYYSNEITACMIHHEVRSVINIEPVSFLARINLFLELVSNDIACVKFLGTQLNYLKSHTYIYAGLHLALAQHKKLGIKYWLKAISIYPAMFFQRRSLAVCKYLIKASP